MYIYIYIKNSEDLASTTLPPSPPPPSIGRHLNPAQGKHEECSEIEKVKDSCGTYDLANKKKIVFGYYSTKCHTTS